MLVLTRSPSQEIRIGHDIIVRVLDVKGDRVRIGIDAPNEVSVHRQEVYLEIERTNQDATQISEPGLAGVLDLAREKNQSQGKQEQKGSQPTLRTAPLGPSGSEVNHGS